MESEDGEAVPPGAIFESEIIADGGVLGDGQKVAKRIDHDVADEVDAFAGPAFFEQMLDGIFFGDEEIVSKGIGENAIDFFGHGAIEAAKSGFDVSYGNAEFYGGQGNGNGGVDVAD